MSMDHIEGELKPFLKDLDGAKAGLTQLKIMVARQVSRFIELGFHTELGRTEDQYCETFTLPEGGVLQPKSYKGRFDIPLLVEPRIALPTQHKLAGIRECIEYIVIDEITNLTPVPEVPYLAWTHDANRYRPYTVEQAIADFRSDEVGSTQLEVTSLYINYKYLFRDHGVDASGSRGGGDRAPYLNICKGEPEVDVYWIGNPDRSWGALSRGKEIIEFGA